MLFSSEPAEIEVSPEVCFELLRGELFAELVLRGKLPISNAIYLLGRRTEGAKGVEFDCAACSWIELDGVKTLDYVTLIGDLIPAFWLQTSTRTSFKFICPAHFGAAERRPDSGCRVQGARPLEQRRFQRRNKAQARFVEVAEQRPMFVHHARRAWTGSIAAKAR